jgi:putative transposase
MYSYEAGVKAVQLYIEFDRGAAPTIRELRYPLATVLRSCYRELDESGDLHQDDKRKPQYSDAEKEPVVEHYLEHGRCVPRTVAKLGHPHRETLRAWIAEMGPNRHIRRMAGSSGVLFSDDQRRRAVFALCSRDAPAEAVAEDLAVSETSLYACKTELLGGGVPVSMERRNDEPRSDDRDGLAREVEVLRNRIHWLQLEHDILKRANELPKEPGHQSAQSHEPREDPAD